MFEVTEQGLYCPAGDFYIDPWRAVPRAVITHAHSDHARAGSRSYLCAVDTVGLLRERFGPKITVEGRRYGESTGIGGVNVSFHPAGHVLGSAQIRLEHRGDVWVVSGDYKTHPDPTCAAFEPVRCHTFLTESTFGLPIYRWPCPAGVFEEIHLWWRANQRDRRTSVLFAYSLGKAQRLLASLDQSAGPFFVHPAIGRLLPHYAAAGVHLPRAEPASAERIRAAAGQGLVIAPPAVEGSPWLNELGEVRAAFVSGWMLLRATRRRRGADGGFALSDHADWDGIIDSIRSTGAERVLVTHGYAAPLARWLNENGWQADTLRTRFQGEVAGESAADRAVAGAAE